MDDLPSLVENTSLSNSNVAVNNSECIQDTMTAVASVNGIISDTQDTKTAIAGVNGIISDNEACALLGGHTGRSILGQVDGLLDAGQRVIQETNGDGSYNPYSSEEDEEYDVNIPEEDDNVNDTEDFVGKQETRCFMCPSLLQSPEKLFPHLNVNHNFDLLEICRQNEADQIFFIKFINFMRRRPCPTVSNIVQEIKGNKFDFGSIDADENMQPVIRDDPLLRYDIEFLLEEEEPQQRSDHTMGTKTPQRTDLSTDTSVEELREIVEKQRALLATLGQQMMEQVSQAASSWGARSVGERSLEQDALYIDSYSNYDIHHEMLSDRVRTLSYRDALSNNPTIMKGARVLDLGCGTGILSLFACEGGAARVDAVEMSSVAYDAMDIVRRNKQEDRIKIHKGRLEELSLAPVDVIVSEWMGYFLLFEGMLDSVITARDRYLKPGGIMMPNRCTMHLCGIDDEALYAYWPGMWKNVYGADMSTIGDKWIKQAQTIAVDELYVATDSVLIQELDIRTCSVSDTTFTSTFSLSPLRTTSMNALCGYFDTFFDLPDRPIFFSTGPHAKTTHWKQTIFYLPRPLPVERGIPVSGCISVRRLDSDVRGLHVTIKLAGHTHVYTLD